MKTCTSSLSNLLSSKFFTNRTSDVNSSRLFVMDQKPASTKYQVMCQ